MAFKVLLLVAFGLFSIARGNERSLLNEEAVGKAFAAFAKGSVGSSSQLKASLGRLISASNTTNGASPCVQKLLSYVTSPTGFPILLGCK